MPARGDRRSLAGGGAGGGRGRRAALSIARRDAGEGTARWRHPRHPESAADRKADRDQRRRSRAPARKHGWQGKGAGRSPPRTQPHHAQGERSGRFRRARASGGGDGQRDVLQAGSILRRRALAPRAGRRANPHQHDPRGAQPADALRRDRRGAGDRLARGARLPGRGYRGDQSALRERRARHFHALRHHCLPAELGADLAGEQGLSELRGRGLLHHRGHQRQPLGADHAAKEIRASGGPVVVEAIRRERGADGAR